MLFNLFIEATGDCFLLCMSSVSPNREPSFLTVLQRFVFLSPLTISICSVLLLFTFKLSLSRISPILLVMMFFSFSFMVRKSASSAYIASCG